MICSRVNESSNFARPFYERQHAEILRRLVVVRGCAGSGRSGPERHSLSGLKRRETQLLAIAEMQARAITPICHPGISGEEDGDSNARRIVAAFPIRARPPMNSGMAKSERNPCVASTPPTTRFARPAR